MLRAPLKINQYIKYLLITELVGYFLWLMLIVGLLVIQREGRFKHSIIYFEAKQHNNVTVSVLLKDISLCSWLSE